ncbi:Host cell factor 1 [Linnemannia zychae]|nr:Host cell factor 1 [Linnemannia zychae]
MAYTTQTNKALIIHGGVSQFNPEATNAQFFALDLTIPLWETTNPPWKFLTTPTVDQGPRYRGKNTMVMSSNQSQVLLLDSRHPYISTYNVESNDWSARYGLPNSFAYGYNFTAAMDPDKNIIFIGNGGSRNSSILTGDMMMVYEANTGFSWTQDMPKSDQLPSWATGYSFVYCAARKSILLFGGKGFGLQGDVYNPYIFEFQMTAYKWVRLNTEGPSPTQIYSHCMVPAYDGFKMVVFGGSVKADVQLGDIYILDVPTMTWMKGSSPPVPLNRSNMACTVGGDNFVAWGGYNAQKAIDVTPIIYNLKKNEWTTTYALISTEKSNKAGTIGGIVAAIVAAAAAGIGFIYYRKRRQREGNPGNKGDTKQKQQQLEQEVQLPPEAYHLHGSLNRGTGSSSSDQKLLSKDQHTTRSAIMTTITPLFARNNSAHFSLNSDSSSVQQQPPVELYEKGYYVPESSLRNPQFYDGSVSTSAAAGTIRSPQLFDASLGTRNPFEDTDLCSSEWMAPLQSGARGPQDYSSPHLLSRTISVATTSEAVVAKTGEEESANAVIYEPPVYHDAQSNFSDARIGGVGVPRSNTDADNAGGADEGNVDSGVTPQDNIVVIATTSESTPISTAKAADQNNTYHSPCPTALHPTSTSILSPSLTTSTLATSSLGTMVQGDIDYQGKDQEQTLLQQEMAMIHAQQIEYQQNLEWLRLESERLEQERLAYLDRLAQLQSQNTL